MANSNYIGNSKVSEEPKEVLRLTIVDGAITTPKIADEAVTEEKLSPEVVEKLNTQTTEIEDNAVTTPKIANGAVTEEKLANGIVSAIASSIMQNIGPDIQQAIQEAIAQGMGNKADVVDIADYINTDNIMPKAALYTYNGLPISNMRWCVDDVNDKILVFCTGYKNPQVKDPYVPTDAFYILFIEGRPTFSGWEYSAQWSINEAPSWITDLFSE